jgi:hypothetical protein
MNDRTELYQNAAARVEQRSAPEAPSTLSPSRESSGQFRPAERSYGREGVERAAGFKPLKEKRDDDAIDSQDRTAMRDAAERIAEQRRSMETEEVKTGLKPKVSITIDQGADALKESRHADVAQAELDSTKAAQKEVDKLRNPHGVETEPRQPQLQTEPDIEAALSHPKVQSAITAKVTEAETQRAAYESGLKETFKARVATLAADFPELTNVPLDKWAAAINAMGQRDLPRARQIAARLQSLGQVENALLQMKTEKTQREQSEFKAYGAKENARFRELTKGVPPQRMAAIQAEIPNMLAACGVKDPRSFLTAIQGQTTFPRASAEMIMMKAAMYDMAMKGAKPTPARAIPPVARPGTQQPRNNSASDGLRQLNQKLSQTGDIKDAARLLAAKRRGR